MYANIIPLRFGTIMQGLLLLAAQSLKTYLVK